jgi:hypothetical protein
MDNIDKVEVALPARKFKADQSDILWREHLNTPGVHPGAQGMRPGDVSTKLRQLAHYIDLNTDPFPADSNMLLALTIAQELAPSVAVPASILAMTPDQQADLILKHVIEPRSRLPVNLDDHEPFVHVARMIGRAGRGSAAEIPDVPDALERAGILVRMWVGCLCAGKTIANDTRSGPNTKPVRNQNARAIDSRAAADPAFAAGLPAAMIIKLRESKAHGRQMYSFDGVPAGTRVYELRKLIPPAASTLGS